MPTLKDVAALAGVSAATVSLYLNGKSAGRISQQKQKEIEEALKDLVLAVEHVGSTSVPLLAAKPIIDLDVVIDQNDLKEVIFLLENHGYIYEIIELLLDNDIDVFTSINIKRFDSINPEFKKISGIGVKNMVPSKFLDMADEIYFIDRRPELMIRDFKNGNLFNKRYMKSGIMKKNFRRDILESYRKVSLEILKKYGDKVTVVERNE